MGNTRLIITDCSSYQVIKALAYNVQIFCLPHTSEQKYYAQTLNIPFEEKINKGNKSDSTGIESNIHEIFDRLNLETTKSSIYKGSLDKQKQMFQSSKKRIFEGDNEKSLKKAKIDKFMKVDFEANLKSKKHSDKGKSIITHIDHSKRKIIKQKSVDPVKIAKDEVKSIDIANILVEIFSNERLEKLFK
ncbi:hypothetical protein ACQ4LE_003277 [Meloidogyne hapla]